MDTGVAGATSRRAENDDFGRQSQREIRRFHAGSAGLISETQRCYRLFGSWMGFGNKEVVVAGAWGSEDLPR
jgi:hypothetical protein